MEVALLTTDTLHHRFFIKEISSKISVSGIVSEKPLSASQFPVNHEIDKLRDEIETNKIFIDETTYSFSDIAETKEVENINDKGAVSFLKKRCPDIIITFGTGIITEEIIDEFPGRLLNLHGGDPEYYRGLDSHLWSIYHNDYDKLITSLHLLERQLDTGKIISKYPLKINKNTKIEELGYLATVSSVHMVLGALMNFADYGYLSATPQTRLGRYYSWMPAELKHICHKKFLTYCQSLEP